jgi:hypothetical protein
MRLKLCMLQGIISKLFINISLYRLCENIILKTDNVNVEFEVFTAVVMRSIIFRDVTPCSLLRCNRRFGGTYRLHLQGRRKNFQQEPACHLLTCWFLLKMFSSTLKMEAICSSETSVASQQTTRRHIPEDDTLQSI